MAYTCFKCLKQFRTLDILWKHLKWFHFFTTKNRTKIVCNQSECKKIYYYGYSYKRHLQTDHAQLEEVGELPPGNFNDIPVVDDEEISDNEDAAQERLHDLNAPRSTEEVTQDLQASTVSYICSLNDSSVPSSTVQKFITTTSDFIENLVETVQEAAGPILQDIDNNALPSDEKVQHLRSILSSVKNPIESSNFATRSQQKKYCAEAGTLVHPRQIELGKIFRGKLNTTTGRTEQKPFAETFQYVPIEDNMKLILEQPGYFESIVQEHEQQQGEPNILYSYRDGDYYRHKSAGNDREIVVDFTLYNDEFETSNPLGSKKGKHKVLGVYMTIISLPRKHQSKLDNILLVALCKSSYVSKYGMNEILKPIVIDLERLYKDGIEINIKNGFQGFVRLRLFQAVGDNLGLNNVLGYAGSFSANYFCRFCKTKKIDTHQQVEEDESCIRTQDNVDSDITVANLSETGLQTSSFLNNLSYYHVAENLAPDIMHDFNEGLLAIELKLVIGELVSQGKFRLDELNARIQSFSYGFTEQTNRPSCITAGQLANPFGPTGQHASQMQCLALYIPLIIGDKVSTNCKFWELYTVLLEIFRIVCAPSISTDGTYYLKSKIKEHHLLYLNLFPEHRLIPKHHILVHYPRAIRSLGPLLQFSSIRPEGNHYPLKRWASVCHNYKNISKTLADKHQESQAFKLLQGKDIDSESLVICDTKVDPVSELQNGDIICDLLHCTPETEVVVCGNVEIYGYKYRPNTMLLSQWIEQPLFVMIKHIIQIGTQVKLIVQPWATEDFDDHYQAYKVSADGTSLQLKDHKDLCDYRPVHAVENYSPTDHSLYIPTRYDLI